jgi:hypothetical protein
MRCIDQPLRGRELALGMNNLGAFFALRLGLLGHGPQHGFRHIDLLHLDVGYFYAPRRSVHVENTLQAQIYFFPVSQQFVQLLFAEHGPQSSLRKL